MALVDGHSMFCRRYHVHAKPQAFLDLPAYILYTPLSAAGLHRNGILRNPRCRGCLLAASRWWSGRVIRRVLLQLGFRSLLDDLGKICFLLAAWLLGPIQP